MSTSRQALVEILKRRSDYYEILDALLSPIYDGLFLYEAPSINSERVFKFWLEDDADDEFFNNIILKNNIQYDKMENNEIYIKFENMLTLFSDEELTKFILEYCI